jgi:uncharacterized membrane protein YjgN (DUF898 family)
MSDVLFDSGTIDRKPASGQTVNVSWAGNPWSLTGLCLLNMLLIIITLGIYWFWARAEYRRYMWQMVRIEGEPLEYTGTGRELLVGYLMFFFFVVIPIIALIALSQFLATVVHPLLPVVLILVSYVGLFFLFLAGIFRAHRYILSRTRWRGIAFGLKREAIGYAWTSMWSGLLMAFTLAWIYPWRTVALRRRLVNAMTFGSVPFRYEGGSGLLYAPFAVLWFAILAVCVPVLIIQLTVNPQGLPNAKVDMEAMRHVGLAVFVVMLAAIPLVIIASSWYEARKLNIFAQATKIDGLSAQLTSTGASVFWLTLTNAFIVLLSLGVLRPVAQARRLRYLVKRFSFTGSTDLDAVLKGQELAGTQGAGLEAAFSIEIF